MPAADAVLIDTNVLIQSAVSGAPFHQRAQDALQDLYRAGRELWVSRQVLREYLSALSRPQTFSQPQPWGTLASDVEQYARMFAVADDGPAVTAQLLDLGRTVALGGKQVHDANIVATMLVYGIPVLLTFNVVDFRRFGALVQVEEPA
jgi:predicted nucleic acid-binding protein